jgi:hypothetical protein
MNKNKAPCDMDLSINKGFLQGSGSHSPRNLSCSQIQGRNLWVKVEKTDKYSGQRESVKTLWRKELAWYL